MKKVNMLICTMLLALCVSSMTACGNKKNTDGTTSAVKGIINDVERGAEELTVTPKTTKAAEESR